MPDDFFKNYYIFNLFFVKLQKPKQGACLFYLLLPLCRLQNREVSCEGDIETLWD